MNIHELATKGDISQILRKLQELEALTQPQNLHLGFISYDEFKKQTGLGTATIWRLENDYGAIKPYRFKGSKKKFYKVAEVQQALENGLI